MEPYIAVILFSSKAIFGIALIEFILARYLKVENSSSDSLTNMTIYTIAQVLRFTLGKVMIVFFLSLFTPFQVSKIPINFGAFLVCLLLVDFFYYWYHRTSHRVRWIWAFHSVHHSSEEMNFSTGIRLPWLGKFAVAAFYIPAVLIGFDPIMVFVCHGAVLIYQWWIHTEYIDKMGWFDKVFNSPANHRVHHGSNEIYLDKNHGGILMLWDHLFGTYQAEEEQVRFGLTVPVGTRNPVLVNFKEWSLIFADIRRASNWGDRWNHLWKGPEWKPSPTP